MALRDSVLLIRDYENIRQILRDIYIFGCFTRDDFIDMGISGRKYDNEQRRISAYLPDKFIQKRRLDKKVLLYCSYQMQDSEKNYLGDTFRNKSFTALDVMSFFFVQQILADGQEITAAELLDLIPNYNNSVVFTKDNLRVKLDELDEKGYIEYRKEGRSVFYKLVDDIWKDFSDSELSDLGLYLEFLKNVSPIEIPYYFLEQKLHLYMQCERKMNLERNKVFAFKHNHLFNSLDNDVLLEILRGCTNKYSLKIQMGDKKDMNVLPVQIIHDSTYGRQYLCCFDIDRGKQSVIRVDKIVTVSCNKKIDEDENNLVQGMKNYFDECWCTSGVNENLKEIVIEFRFDDVEEAYILRRIKYEGHGGEIRKIQNGVFEYRIKLGDPNEMIPWIRSFGERARVLHSDGKNTIETIASDWKKAVKNYESI
ncbi:WYL domain-containing protein [Anaerotignum propionicum]|uniref:helix-turn-helix transcriptional regulator n=1 Tax=Anaerotignum propionicum TaxID=28446 RepID=UPI00289CE23B|nr:WYL domain-containing protein [Anaerotignum propionicum]